MGGVPVLLMMAAIGITYGWQPDDNGGVEYIIQIPPDQLREIERTGEISSVIDPAVQGHVSRVIIKVGTSNLPRITPRNLGQLAVRSEVEGAVVAVSDHSPVPIPEMGDARLAIPIPSLNETASTNTAVMKPDANDPASGPGFSFPSALRDTAAAAAEGFRSGVDRAGRDIGNRTSAQLGNTLRNGADALGRVPPPSTRTPSLTRQAQAPSFTGGDTRGQLASPRAGGPSTNPINTRDSSWRDLDGRNLTGARPGGPSTDPINQSGLSANNRFDNRPTNTQLNSTNSLSNRRGGASGLSASDTFGKMPDALAYPGAGDGRTAGYPDRNPQTSLDYANSAQGRNTGGVYSQQQQTQLDRQSQLTNAPYGSATQRELAANGQRQPTYDQRGPALSNPALSNPATNNQAPSFAGNPSQNLPQTSPDPRLTAAQIAAGAWSVDAYNRLVDRTGRLLPTRNPNPAVPAYDPTRMPSGAQTGPYSDRVATALGQPSASAPTLSGMSLPGYNPQAGQGQYDYERTLANRGPSFVRETSQPRSAPVGTVPVDSRGELIRRSNQSPTNAGTFAGETRTDPPSLSDRRTGSVIGSAIQPRPVAAQPLFNGLLLLSFVANVYLIFWLKNLRLQFHDLVAAKRMTSGTPTT